MAANVDVRNGDVYQPNQRENIVEIQRLMLEEQRGSILWV